MLRLFAREVVNCVSEGREPTVGELFQVAERMWVEGAGGRSAFAWGELPPQSDERVLYLRAGPSCTFREQLIALVAPQRSICVSPGMARSATDIVHDIINATVVDAIVALKDASKGLPNALLREVNAIHANTAFGDLPEPARSAVAASVRAAFSTLQKDGYVIAEAKSVQAAPAPQDHRPSSHLASGPRRQTPKPGPGKRPRPSR